jgi:hypothetical protein
MQPTTFLAATLCITLGAWAIHKFLRHRSTGELRRLAVQWQAHYAPSDCFDILPHVLEHLPVPGAANVVVFDVLYSQDHDRYQYVFTVEYTQGVIQQKYRRRRVGMLREARESRGGEGWLQLELAPAELPLLRQYEHFYLPQAPAANLTKVG